MVLLRSQKHIFYMQIRKFTMVRALKMPVYMDEPDRAEFDFSNFDLGSVQKTVPKISVRGQGNPKTRFCV